MLLLVQTFLIQCLLYIMLFHTHASLEVKMSDGWALRLVLFAHYLVMAFAIASDLIIYGEMNRKYSQNIDKVRNNELYMKYYFCSSNF